MDTSQTFFFLSQPFIVNFLHKNLGIILNGFKLEKWHVVHCKNEEKENEGGKIEG